jgi:hypothetical protein
LSEASISGSANIACAIMVPAMPPATCARRNAAHRAASVRASSAKTSDTAGLKCAPEIGPENGDENHQDRAGRQRIAEQRQRDVLGQVSAMMPEPTTVRNQ